MDRRLVVLSYPKLSQKDYDWIQRVRAVHDMYHGLVEPHITFVFPSRMDESTFVKHVKQLASGMKEFGIVARCALTVKDTYGRYSQVFLIPDEGFSSIVRIHDRLYTGILAPELRLDIPFYPHIGIGNSTDVHECKRLADELNSTNFEIEGIVDALDIAELQSERVPTGTAGEENQARAVNTIEHIVLA